MISSLLSDASAKMDHAVEHTVTDFSGVRTGRANAGILIRVVVDYYGVKTPLQQLAGFSVPDARMLVVQPFDKSTIPAIERGIQEAGLGLNPSNDGTVIRLAFPPLTEERRRELIKVVRGLAEEGRVAIRTIRRHCKDSIEEEDVSEDDVHRAEKELQKLTDTHVVKIDEALTRKEEELLEV
ncbi:MAG: ribosome recycling factor [Actinomycetota bacterium]|nr:ribosome recycling factor [Actinomycetota bacterium]